MLIHLALAHAAGPLAAVSVPLNQAAPDGSQVTVTYPYTFAPG